MRRLFLLLMMIGGTAGAAEMVTVPAGEFSMGCSPGDTRCEADEKPVVKVVVPAFAIDKHEVTVVEYRACVDAGRCKPPKTHARNKYCNYAAPGRDAHPVNCVDWDDARAYCAGQGKRLPREAEWEKAARAGTTTAYPRGPTATCREVVANDGQTSGSVKGELDGCGEDGTAPVGSRKPNSLGIHDMNGNAGEWVANGYAPDALAHYARGRLDYPQKSPGRVIRGGSWDEPVKNVRSSFRNSKPPVSGEVVYGSVGFRCARSG